MKAKAFALCLDNKDCEASLELLKLYPLAPAERNDPTGYIRIIDESGEDYLYPSKQKCKCLLLSLIGSR